MEEFVRVLAIASLFAVINNGVVEYLFKPLCEHFKIDAKWLMYVSVVTAQIIVWALGLNLFVGFGVIPSREAHIVTTILTGLVIARGSNYIADLPWPAQPGL